MLVLALLALFEWRPLTELVLQTSKHEWPRETQPAVVVVNPLSSSSPLSSSPELELTLVLSEIFHSGELVSPAVSSDCP